MSVGCDLCLALCYLVSFGIKKIYHLFLVHGGKPEHLVVTGYDFVVFRIYHLMPTILHNNETMRSCGDVRHG